MALILGGLMYWGAFALFGWVGVAVFLVINLIYAGVSE